MFRRVFSRNALLGFFAGTIIAWFVAGTAYYVLLQLEALSRPEAVDFELWLILLIGICGGIAGTILGITMGGRPLPKKLQFIARGSLYGVLIVVLATLFCANVFGGPKRDGPYLLVGLFVGIPSALVLGGLSGWFVARKSENQENRIIH